jgi:hypothetical protein
MICGIPSFWIGVATAVGIPLVAGGLFFWLLVFSEVFGPGPPPGSA